MTCNGYELAIIKRAQFRRKNINVFIFLAGRPSRRSPGDLLATQNFQRVWCHKTFGLLRDARHLCLDFGAAAGLQRSL